MDSQADPVPAGSGAVVGRGDRTACAGPSAASSGCVSVLVLAALVVGTTFVSRSGVEDALESAASKHLDAVGMKGVALEVDGRQRHREGALRARPPRGRGRGGDGPRRRLRDQPSRSTATRPRRRPARTSSATSTGPPASSAIPFVGTTRAPDPGRQRDAQARPPRCSRPVLAPRSSSAATPTRTPTTSARSRSSAPASWSPRLKRDGIATSAADAAWLRRRVPDRRRRQPGRPAAQPARLAHGAGGLTMWLLYLEVAILVVLVFALGAAGRA